MSQYRTIIDQTTATLDRRAKYFRNLIVAVTVVGLGSILWTAISWSWLTMTSIFILVPICGLFLIIDGSVLNNWRVKILTAWERCEIDISAFQDAISSISTLPKNSIRSMLATLPPADDLVAEQGISPSTRNAVSIVVTAINRCRLDLLAFKTIGFTILGFVIVATVVLWQWQPLTGIAAIGIVGILTKWKKNKHLRRATESIREIKKASDFNLEKFENTVNTIKWSPISVVEKQMLLSSV